MTNSAISKKYEVSDLIWLNQYKHFKITLDGGFLALAPTTSEDLGYKYYTHKRHALIIFKHQAVFFTRLVNVFRRRRLDIIIMQFCSKLGTTNINHETRRGRPR